MKKKRLVQIFILLMIGLLIWKGSAFLFFEKRKLSFAEPTSISLRLSDAGVNFDLITKAKTVAELLGEHEIVLQEGDLIFPLVEERIFAGGRIEIWREKKVEIEVDNALIEHRTFSLSTEKVLMDAGVELSKLDRTEPRRVDMVDDGEKIVVTRINIEKILKTEVVDFKTIEREDSKLRWRKTEIEQQGTSGEKIVEYEMTYKNGKKISTKILSSETTKKTVDKIVRVGTKIKVGKVKDGIASWYRYTGKLTCASRIFPRGTWLRVTNNENGKQVIVEVRDFGPEKWTGRRIDLEAVAFERIASLGKGLVNVKVEEILE